MDAACGHDGYELVQGGPSMTPVNPVPEHLHTVTPRLVVRRGSGSDAISFYAAALGGSEVADRVIGPHGELIHAELRIGDSIVMVTEDDPDGDAPVKSPP